MSPSAHSPAVVVENLTKRYKGFTAVNGISFEVGHGEVFALLGPNGAGKTTTVEILEGFRSPDEGKVRVLGFDPSNRSTQRSMRERMGVVLQELAIEPFLTVRELLARSASYFPAPRSIDEVIEAVGLAKKASSRVKGLSGGQQRRLDLGLGIIGNPDLLFLDEPTTGFDPSARRDAWDIVKDMARGGTTVILTTHYMDEAEALADRLAVISLGKIVASGTPESIGGREVSEATVRFKLPHGTTFDDLPSEIMGIVTRSESSELVKLTTDDEVRVMNILTGWALSNGHSLRSLTLSRLTLEDIYLRLTGSNGQALLGSGAGTQRSSEVAS